MNETQTEHLQSAAEARLEASAEQLRLAIDQRVRAIVRDEFQKMVASMSEQSGPGTALTNDLMSAVFSAAGDAFAQDDKPQEQRS